MKVLGSMFSLDNVVLSEKLLSKFEFLREIGINGGKVFIDIQAKTNEMFIYIIMSFILVFLFNNSMERLKEFKLNNKTVLLSVFCMIYSILSLNKISEFLYFNF
jgi:uncharacterized membrane protein